MINGNVEALELVGNVATKTDIDATVSNLINFETTLNPITRVATDDYERCVNKPKVNYVELVGNKTLDELDIQVKGDYPDEALTNGDIEHILDNFV